jgi:hypothetical protein
MALMNRLSEVGTHARRRVQSGMRKVALMMALGLPGFLHAAPTILEMRDFSVMIDEAGRLTSFKDTVGDVDYGMKDQPSPLLMVRIQGEFVAPEGMSWSAEAKRLELDYGTVRAEVEVNLQPSYCTFELVRLSPMDQVDRVQWGPLATRIRETVGELVGVVRNTDFAIGLQVLNPKTLGGPSDNDEGREVSRGRTALVQEWGSTLQAYSMDRSRPREISVWGGHFPRMPVPPIRDETVLGSRIALFGCKPELALERMGQIGKAEGLPHPEFDGIWHRMNPDMGRSYLIVEFTEETIEEVVAHAVRAGFHSVYHGHPFQSWGHYEPRKDHFPNGMDGVRHCVEVAARAGLRLGVHTLSNFIQTHDPYITPVPDPRLAVTGSSSLSADIDAEATDIPVEDVEYFANSRANWLRTARVGSELIRYGRVSETAPWRLLDCQRGAWGTMAQSHRKGRDIDKLLDHPYRVFFPNYEMQHEIAIRLAQFMNETGVGHMDFDGHEGCWASGQGTFAEEMFAWEFYRNLKRPVHNGSSGVRSFHWRINSNANWGEPWYGGFRDSMAEYRFNNQALFERNYMPNMMGWFQLTETTTRADIEWLMARNAGYNAGFALSTQLNTLRNHPNIGELMDVIRAWEHLRFSNRLTPGQMALLRDPSNEYRLEWGEGEGEGQSDGEVQRLRPIHRSPPFVHERRILQPGEPTASVWNYHHADAAQKLQFIAKLLGSQGKARDLWLEVDGYQRVELPVTLEIGQTLVCDGTRTLRLYDSQGRQISTHVLTSDLPLIRQGMREVQFDAAFEGEPSPTVELRFRREGIPLDL